MVTVARTASLRGAVDTLVKEHVHRVYVTDEADRPKGLVTITGVVWACVCVSLSAPLCPSLSLPHRFTRFESMEMISANY